MTAARFQSHHTLAAHLGQLLAEQPEPAMPPGGLDGCVHVLSRENDGQTCAELGCDWLVWGYEAAYCDLGNTMFDQM